MTSKHTARPFDWLLAAVGTSLAWLVGVNRHPAEDPPSESVEAGYELREANSRGLMWFGFGLAATLACLLVSLSLVFFALRRGTHFAAPQADSSISSIHELPPAPRLQTNPSADLKNYLERERTRLSTYGWVDRSHSVARIPVDRAIDLMVKR